MSIKRIITIFASVLLLGLTITAVSFYFSPIGQRWQARQTEQVAQVGTTDIDIVADSALNHVFAPAVTQVSTGSTVTWHFKEIDEDGIPVNHNVVFEDEASPVQATGTFSKTFNEDGVYQYVCTLHPFMEGVVIVTTTE